MSTPKNLHLIQEPTPRFTNHVSGLVVDQANFSSAVIDNVQKHFISQFSPQRTSGADLEAILVQRQTLLAKTVAKLKESLLGGSKHYFMFIGARGMGKTHLLSMIFHRLSADAELKGVMRVAWLNEDETSTTFLKLLLRIYRDLATRYPDEFASSALDDIYPMKPEPARAALGTLLLDKLKQHQVLLLIENCDSLFAHMSEPELRNWRGFIQTHPIFAIAASAQALFTGISKRTETFFGFFDTQTLKPLDAAEARELLSKIATLNHQAELAAYLETSRGRARVMAIHHLAGGNPRLYIILSSLITPENLDELVRPFEAMVDQQLTPYYQERMRWLSPQQQEIVQALCKSSQPINVNQLAQMLFATHSTVTSQLKKLREMGYVLGHEKGREARYELAEPLMRLSWQVKESSDSKPLALLVDFLRVWYERDELERKLATLSPDARAHAYVQYALSLMKDGMPNLRHDLLRKRFKIEGSPGPESVKVLAKLDDEDFNSLLDLALETNELSDTLNVFVAGRSHSRDDQLMGFANCLLGKAPEFFVSSDHFLSSTIVPLLILVKDPLSTLIGTNSETGVLLLRQLNKAPYPKGMDILLLKFKGEILENSVRAVYSNGPVWADNAQRLVSLFRENAMLTELDAALVGNLAEFTKAYNGAAALYEWHGAWFTEWKEPSIAKLLIQCAIEYLRTGKEEAFLDLHQEHRSLLRQALGLDPTPV